VVSGAVLHPQSGRFLDKLTQERLLAIIRVERHVG